MMKTKKYHSKEIDKIFNELSLLEIEQSKIKMLVSVKIEEIMQMNGISKVELAIKTNKQPSVITKWLSGTQNFTIDILSEIAYALGVPISIFFNQQPTQLIFKKKLVIHSNKPSLFKAHKSNFQSLLPTTSISSFHL